MKLHRFYISEMHNRFGEIKLAEEIWVHDPNLLNQWLRVLRYRVGDELVIFNDQEERLYRIEVIEKDSVKLNLVTELARKIPERKIYLLWSLLKKDKNDWVLQKATELGVHKFVPIIAERSERTELNLERAQKILIEASEQSGRADIPLIREPLSLKEAVHEYSQKLPLFVAEMGHGQDRLEKLDKAAVLIGPEGGWSDQEKIFFEEQAINRLSLSNLTLRAETAAVVAVYSLI